MKRSVIIALMSYTGKPVSQVKSVCYTALAEMAGQGWSGSLMELEGDAMLPRARNAAVSRFLSVEDATDLIFIDDDNYPETASDLVRLVDHPVDVVAAPCRAKTEAYKWPVRWRHTDIVREDNGLIEVWGVGTGILRISRACIEKMCAAYADRWYDDPSSPTGKTIELFQYSIDNHTWWGEDLLFCKRWSEVGGRVYIDPDIVTVHVGSFEYRGSVGEWLRSMPGNWDLRSPEIGLNSKVVNRMSAQFDVPAEAAE